MGLTVKTQGVRGGDYKENTKVAHGIIFINNAFISIDAYEGYGDSFKERETPLIDIRDSGGNVIFLGTFLDLKLKLK